ncbi:transposase [Kordia sp. TARA_039_SRF]|nr:transposase [Kordia sp. TARA_039_SRF]
MSRKYKFHNASGVYFISFATVYWLDVFTRQLYFDILTDSIDYCRKYKGMKLYCYCIMPNHLHLIFQSTENNPSGLLRDFKKFTSKKLVQAIKVNPKESRKKWFLDMFEKAGKERSNVAQYQFWQQHNHPIELWSDKIIKQKINYIHNNPVKAGFVINPTDWKYSSARNFCDDYNVLEIDEM